MNQKALKTLGWIATCTAMLMYITYFPQIMNNLHGMKSASYNLWLRLSTVPYG